MAISVDTPEESRDLSAKAGYTFTILSDSDTTTIRAYRLLHKGGAGHDIARPAEFLVDRNGIVRWENFTEDIRVRPRPEQMLKEARKLQNP